MTGVAIPCGAADPAARKPRAVAVTASTWSPGSSGIPGAAASCHDRPVLLVHDAPGPRASQPAGPATIAVGTWPWRWLAAAAGEHGRELPRAAGIGGDEELGPADIGAGFRPGGDNGAAIARDRAQGLEDPSRRQRRAGS